MVEIDARELARAIREQKALPISEDEAEGLARAIESSIDDQELVASVLAAIRLLDDHLDCWIAHADAAAPSERA